MTYLLLTVARTALRRVRLSLFEVKSRIRAVSVWTQGSREIFSKSHRGFYHDAIFVKRNNFNLLLHETFGGGLARRSWLEGDAMAVQVATDASAATQAFALG